MENKNISIEKIKSVVSMLSMTVLTIQYGIGMFTKEINIPYIPLIITFITIFINTLNNEEIKWIRITSFIGAIIIAISGCIIYTICFVYEMDISDKINTYYSKTLCGIITIITLILSILYAKRTHEIE